MIQQSRSSPYCWRRPVRRGASSAVLEDRIRAKFPTAAVAVFEFTGDWDQVTPGSARLTCFMTPRELIQRG